VPTHPANMRPGPPLFQPGSLPQLNEPATQGSGSV
jgi:hypothetical protein